MATVAQVAKASLQRILVQASEAPLEADEYQDFIFAMNNYMMSLDAQGIHLGYTEVSNLSDTVTVPVGALRGIIANVAIEVAPDYGGIVTDALVLQAREGLQSMRMLGQTIGATRLPSTLPIGSGNSDTTLGWSYTFYPDSEESILAETIGTIALESSTNG
jgi:hypothetical protein